MIITVLELQKDVDKYLDLAQSEDIYVVENGKIKIKISSANDRPLDKLDGIFADYDISDEEIDSIKNKKLENI